jgi:TolA-binding protein
MYLKSRGVRYAILSLSIVLIFSFAIQAQQIVGSGQPAAAVTVLDSSKEQDGLVGSVRRVKTEAAKLEFEAGQVKEGPRRVLEITTYDLKGKRLENVSYPILSPNVGKEEYRYDPKGNIVEMTLRSDDGSILSREAYDYEFDRFGNWKKMTTSLVVFEGGELKREPVEVTYRTFTYYFDEAVATVVGSRPEPTIQPEPTIRTNPSLPNAKASASDNVAIDVVVSEGTLKERRPLNVSEPPPAPPAIQVERPSNPDPVVKSERAESDSPRAQPVSFAPTVGATPEPEAAKIEAAKIIATPGPGNAASEMNGAYGLYSEGRARLDSGDAKGAVNSFLKSLELEPNSAEVNLSLGSAYLKLKDSSEAGKAFKQAVALNPKLAEAHYGLGITYFNQKQYTEAAQSFKRAVAIEPGMAKAHFGLALAYQQSGDQDRLMKEFRILEKLDADLAKKLRATFPQFNLPCRAAPFCR